jgi:hypothetical protein
MPPMYPWKDEVTLFEIDVLRPAADSALEPTEEEVKDEIASILRVGKPVPALSDPRRWIRTYGAATLHRGASWGPGKGYW